MYAATQSQIFPAQIGPLTKPIASVPVRLRQASLEDLPALRELIDVSVRALNAGDYTQKQIESALQFEYGADNRQLVLERTYYVAEIDNRIVGSGGWSRRKNVLPSAKSKVKLADPRCEPAKIRAFFVHPNYARRGIATSILEASEKAARLAGFHQLELIATLTGEPVYAHFGFTAVERMELTLPDGVVFPATRMVKAI